jgi:hypothetical protein
MGGPKVTEVKFDPKTPIEIPGAKRTGAGRQGWVVAIPKDAAKNYGTEKAFIEAVQKGKVEGMAKTRNLDSMDILKETDKRDIILREHKFERLDGKNIILSTKKDEGVPTPKPAEPKKDSADEEDAPPSGTAAPRGGMLIAGVAAVAAIMLGGLWFVGRTRRKP